jgi:hypothetical protein
VKLQIEAASRLKQASQGIMIFKLAMDSFAAISLIVGNIGIMKQEAGGSGQEAAKRVEPRLRAPICDLRGATAYRLRTSYM